MRMIILLPFISQSCNSRPGTWYQHLSVRTLPDALICRVVGLLVIAIGARYLWAGLS